MVLSKYFNEYEHWIRCIIAINHHIRNALLDILHDPENGLPRNSKKLYNELEKEYEKGKNNKLKYLIKKKILSTEEINLLMPDSGISNSQDWDITVIIVVIRNFYKGLKAPKGGWGTIPNDDDISLAAYLVLAREIRNLFFHSVMDKFKPLSELEFQMKTIKKILVGLAYKNIDDFDAEDCLYMIDLAVVKKALQISSNSTYSCEKCSRQLEKSKFNHVIDKITQQLEKKEEEGMFKFFMHPFF